MRKTRKPKTVYSEVAVDPMTGEVVSGTTIKRYPSEPLYVKVYLDGPLELLGKVRVSVVMELARRMTYSGDSVIGNYVSINSPFGEQIAEDLGLSMGSVRRIVSDLVETGVVRRIGRGQYQVNPYLFGKGEWIGVAQLRDSWPLK